MAAVVVVHGIGKQFLGARSLHGGVAAALLDGLSLAGGQELGPEDVGVAFYGHLFRTRGAVKGEPAYTYRDVSDPDEVALLYAWWREAARLEPDRVPPPEAEGMKAATPRTVQRALYALSRSRFLARTTERFLIGVLKQVRLYLGDAEIRGRVQEEVAAAIGPDTRVVVGHSLGSVAAYETLAAWEDGPSLDFVTIGSPLGIPHLVFDRLQPTPSKGHGHRPGCVRHWTNVCDRGDVVALVKRLAPSFGDVDDVLVANGWQAHAIEHHLTAVETGRAIARGLHSPGSA
ncbi:hypothetical protein [Streptomyces sp. LMG1-1-1.1]|uniref:hypothetical protein n=1 Tax=Streptomyces sp. LMG1-1-1.1 TaxID=3135245 RepID=UPI003466CA92